MTDLDETMLPINPIKRMSSLVNKSVENSRAYPKSSIQTRKTILIKEHLSN